MNATLVLIFLCIIGLLEAAAAIEILIERAALNTAWRRIASQRRQR